MMRRAPMAPDVGRVVGADGGRHLRVGESLAFDELLEVADRGQHDVDHVLGDDLLDRLQKFFARLQARVRPLALAGRADGVKAGTHVRILGVGDNEISAFGRAGADPRELFIETSHSGPPPCGLADYNSTTRRGNGAEG